MFFVLSKILNFLTNPLVLVLLVFAYAIFTKVQKRKKISFWLALSLLIFFSNRFIANEIMRGWEVDPIPYADIRKTYEWGIVLTGVTNSDQLPRDRIYFNKGADRVIHTVELYKKGIIKNIMISGGSGRLISSGQKEADEIFQVMLLMGVPAEAMAIENESRNTHESAMKVKELFKNNPLQDYLLVTSASHMRRSAACFRKEGFSIDVFSTDFNSGPRVFTPDVLLVPRSDAISVWQQLFREWTGMIAYKVAGYI